MLYPERLPEPLLNHLGYHEVPPQGLLGDGSLVAILSLVSRNIVVHKFVSETSRLNLEMVGYPIFSSHSLRSTCYY